MKLAGQRWYAGAGEPAELRVVADEQLTPRLRWRLVEADGETYQLLLCDDEDALAVAEASLDLLSVVAPGETAERVRPIGVEQSNTSLVYDERLILKVYRRLSEGAALDVEVTQAVADAGFAHVAEAVAVWKRDGRVLAFLQRYLAGGAEGWAMALTSLRDLYANDCSDPGDCGGDFAPEASRLGAVTAELHLALARAFGSSELRGADLAAELDVAVAVAGGAERIVERARSVIDAGRATRVHGDYHLGQVLRTDEGWAVLDFEGEPARPVGERRRPTSPLKDVAGMVRSLHYAVHVALCEQDPADRARLAPLASAWEERNRTAFLRGYRSAPGIEGLVPADERSFFDVLSAFELEKAAYELAYEQAYRPEWAVIPQAALDRLLAG